ncbi:MAG: fasciclin domain-containing protein [Phycisphaerales bacterium]|nr:fasciclin domain-containing protein [Phycisphaerales bacterium]
MAAEPAKNTAPAAPAKPAAAPAVTLDIVDTAAANKDFSTLVTAIKAAGLVDALKGKGPFTVFAPTNAAFEKLPKGTLESLLKPENKEKLAEILKFHVIPASVLAADVVKLGGKESSKTLQGSSFLIEVKDGKVSIGSKDNLANVTATDIKTTNGVIHVIDAVILPPAKAEPKKEEKKGA